jgi:hypothetical protein
MYRLQQSALAAACVLFVFATFWGCSSTTSSNPAPSSSVTTNTVFFDSLYTNVEVNAGFAGTHPWTLGTLLSPTIPVNFRFASKPTANGTYTLVTLDNPNLSATECEFFINYLDGVNSTSYFPKTSNTKTATVTIINGKVNVVVDGIEMEGNRGGKAVQPVKANLLEK